MKYKIIFPWRDIDTDIVHPVGEIVEMDDKVRGDKLVKLGAFEEIKEEPKKEEKPKEEKPKTTSRKKK